MYTIFRKQNLNITAEDAWRFFSDPGNLSEITPPYMGFRILSNSHEGTIHDQQHIRYRIAPVLGIPLSWKTRIEKVYPPFSFKDIQEHGPYKIWEHTHTFMPKDGKVEMTDEVLYDLPLGFIGKMAHALFVKKQLEKIFDYRKMKLDQLFNSNK